MYDILSISTFNYTVCVILTPNYVGDMQNNLKFTDRPVTIETYEAQHNSIIGDRYFTDKNYYEWKMAIYLLHRII